MTALPATGHISNAARTQGEVKTDLEAIVSFLTERLGSAGGWVATASASTVTLGTKTDRLLSITGTTTITSFGTTSPGDSVPFMLKFAGALTLTHGSNLICPGAANIVTAANDVATVVWEGSNVWRIINYTRQSGRALAGSVVQVVQNVVSTVATGTTAVPLDNTIPQNTEGDQYLSVTITPVSSTSKLIIDVVLNFALANTYTAVMGLFQDSTANALCAATNSPAGPGYRQQLVMKYTMTSGTTSATTFKVRAGAAPSTTMTVNGASGSQEMGGVMGSVITVTEVLA